MLNADLETLHDGFEKNDSFNPSYQCQYRLTELHYKPEIDLAIFTIFNGLVTEMIFVAKFQS